MKTSLLCSYEKDAALQKLGEVLHKNGWNLLGSAGTAKFLNEAGIPCRDVAEIVGEPILGHRVVTLAREIYAGLLSRDEDAAELSKLNIQRIDLVYVTLYPLEQAIAAPGSKPQDVLKKTDIGGPTLLRAAAKGRRIVLSSPGQIDEFEQHLKENAFDERYLVSLAAAAERRVAGYVAESASYWEEKTS